MLRLFKQFHWKLFVTTLLICATGVLTIYSASYESGGYYAMKQMIWIGVAVAAMLAVVAIGYRLFLNMAYLLYVFAILLLVVVLIIGAIRGGAQSWFSLGVLSLQPSEFAKMATILCLTAFLGSRKNLAQRKTGLLLAFLLVFFPLILIVKQPDLGTALVFVPILFAMIWVWGARIRHLISVMFFGLAAFPVFWMSLKAYQKRRLLVFLNPDTDPLGAGYTAIQSKIAVGSGGFWGRGFLNGTQHLLNFLPEHHTDFIFGVWAEEWGFLGSVALLLLYSYLIWQMFSVLHYTTDPQARLLASGIITMFFFHVFINIGMTIGLMPITGLPLPFMSYGGSSLVSFFVAVGFVISIYKERSFF